MTDTPTVVPGLNAGTGNPIPSASTVQNPFGGPATDYGRPDLAKIASANLANAFGAQTKEPTVMSTDGATKTLNSSVQDHLADTKITSQPQISTSQKTPEEIKSAGGLTADEARAAGIDLSGYMPVPGTQYFTPKTQEQTLGDQFKADKAATDTAFNTQVAKMDSSNDALISTIRQVYSDRMAAQVEINRRQEASTNTEDIRGGATRYAPGVAQSILTGEENVGLSKLSAISNEMLSKISEANSNLTNKKYQAFVDNRNQIDKLKTEYNSQIKDLHAAAVKSVEDKRTYDLNVAKFNETKSKDAFDSAYKTEELRLKRQQAGLGLDDGGHPVQQVVSTDAKGAPVKADQQAFLAKLTPAIAIAVRELTDYKMNPANLSLRSAGGGSSQRQTMLTLAHQYDPTFDEKKYQVASKIMADYTSGAVSKNIIALNTAVGHIRDLSQSFVNLPNSDLTKYNTVADWVASNLGQGSVTKVAADLNAITGELASTFKTGGATDQEISNIKSGISINSSPTQFKAFIEEASKLLGSRLTALDDTYKNAVGKPFDRSFLNPSSNSTLSKLKDGGYDIQVPGVRNSDPVSFSKSSPENKAIMDTIRAKFPELTPAQAMQVAQAQLEQQ